MMQQDLPVRFPDAVLERIAAEGMIYQCACPAQVAEKLLGIRAFFSYQRDCAGNGDALGVHGEIMRALAVAHAELETCLDRVLELEQWDRQTWRMPEGLRKLRDDAMDLS